MLKRYVMMGVLAASFTGAGVAAQTQSTPPSPAQQMPTERPETRPEHPRTDASQRASGAEATTTLSGCVYREGAVAGRTPNAAEQAGILEDYILADVKPASESTSAAASSGTSSSTPGAVGTSGSSNRMYKLEQIADERLQSLVGKRVEVVGRIDAEREDGAANRAAGATSGQGDASAGPDRVNLPEFEVAEIREVAGTCPARPSGR